MARNWRHYPMACALVGSLTACAASVRQAPVDFHPRAASMAAPRVAVLETVTIKLPTAYIRTVDKGSRWALAGQVPQGDVYRPVGTVFTIEGRQVHEAYLVVSQQAIVGFYLPGDRTYSALPTPVSLSLGDMQ